MTSLSVVETLTSHTFERDFLARNRPVKIKSDPGVRVLASKWTLDYLVDKSSGDPLHFLHFPSGDRNDLWQIATMSLAEYVRRVRVSPDDRKRFYLSDQTTEDVCPGAAGDVRPPTFVSGRPQLSSRLFAGVSTFTNAHYHSTPMEAVLTQVAGRKTVILVPAERYRALRPHPWFSATPHFSSLPCMQDTPHGVSLRPNPSGSEAVECVLEPGEALYIPQGWFHWTRGDGENISLTYFFNGSWRHAHFPVAMRDAMSYACTAVWNTWVLVKRAWRHATAARPTAGASPNADQSAARE